MENHYQMVQIFGKSMPKFRFRCLEKKDLLTKLAETLQRAVHTLSL